MFSHIMVGTNDLERSRRFYDAVLGALGIAAGHLDKHRIFWRTRAGVFSASLPIDGKPATAANGGTIGFARVAQGLLGVLNRRGCTASAPLVAWLASLPAGLLVAWLGSLPAGLLVARLASLPAAPLVVFRHRGRIASASLRRCGLPGLSFHQSLARGNCSIL